MIARIMRTVFFATQVAVAMAILIAVSTDLRAEPLFTKQDLFSGHDDVNIYRIPSLIVSPKGTILAFCEARHGDDHFAAYDLSSGKEVWRVLAPGWSVVPQPAIGHGLVIYNHDYDHPELMAVKLGGKGDVTESHVAWRIKRGAPSTPSPLLVGDELYFVSDSGIASCVNAKTGEPHWTERLGGNYSASPLFANNSVLFLSETGMATWVQAGRKFVVLGKNKVSGRTLATPAFSAGTMYLRTDEHLYKIAR